MYFVGVGKSVGVQVVGGCSRERIGVRAIDYAVRIAVAQERIRAQEQLFAVRYAVEVGIRHRRVGEMDMALDGVGNRVCIAVGVACHAQKAASCEGVREWRGGESMRTGCAAKPSGGAADERQ